MYGVLLFGLWSLGGVILSDGWQRIDSSPHRDLLYALFTTVIPVVITLSIVHASATIARSQVWIPSLLVALLTGIAGPVLLHVSIVTSDDPVADMAYLSLVHYYCFFFLVTFLTLCAVLSRISRQKTAECKNPPASSQIQHRRRSW